MQIKRMILSLAVVGFIQFSHAQNSFWENVRFGGNLGIGFGDGYFSGTLAPSAVYEFNPYFAIGPGLNFSYIKDDFYKATVVGGSLTALVNPYPSLQLSAEFEELHANQKLELEGGDRTSNFWNTALFLGVGYRTGPVTIGVRYNVLFDEDDRIYANATQPFVRFYF
tara:strand:+ start:324 stop:824 length:501 start_codon:yes stop_codon:yes gene_type:complete